MREYGSITLGGENKVGVAGSGGKYKGRRGGMERNGWAKMST